MTVHPSPDHELVRLPSTPAAAPYSNASVLDRLIFTAGVLPVRGDGTTPDEFADQVRQALGNLEQVLAAAGADWGSVLKVNGYVTDIQRLPELNAVYTEVLGIDALPPRTTVEVPRFRGATMVEFDAVAYRRA
ncbi:MAG: RidA family protein [Dermatophilus congolensis]|nr:RidA family protein [Dermatophilus congolensis]